MAEPVLTLQQQHPLPVDDAVLFRETSHQYGLRDCPTRRFTTVTQAVSRLLPPFNADLISAKLSKSTTGKYAGMSAAAIRNEWKLAAHYGTRMHAAIEDFYNGRQEVPHLPIDFCEVDTFLQSDLDLAPFRSELRMADAASGLAGTADQIFQKRTDPTKFVIIDWKRTAPISKSNPFENGYHELAHLPATKFMKFAMQLNLYAILFRQSCGLTAVQLLLVAMHPDNGYEIHDVPFMPEAEAVYNRYVRETQKTQTSA